MMRQGFRTLPRFCYTHARMLATLFQSHRTVFIAGALAVFLGALVGGSWYFKGEDDTALPPPALLAPLATSTPGDGEPIIRVLPVGPAPYRGGAVAVLNADQEFLKQVPDATYKKSLTELAELSAKLAANPNQPALWMRVAYVKHFYGDEIGTRDAYEYLNIIFPADPIPFYNLGLLYAYYLKEPAKAVPKYEAALRLNPRDPTFYIGLADFYREVMGDLGKAEATLRRGLEVLPDDINLAVALAILSEQAGNISQAISFYERVLNSTELGEGERAAILEAIGRLRAK